MSKWFEETGKPQGIIVSSRVRLARNIDGYAFPGKMEAEKKKELFKELKESIQGMMLSEDELSYYELSEMEPYEKLAMRERRLINSTIAARKEDMGLFASEDESVSLLLGGDDHVRMQCILPGSALLRGYRILDDLEERIGERYDYAFHEKYGYLTSFPTNMGTGMRVTMTLHLPEISRDKEFKALKEEIARMGISLKGVFPEPAENHGSLFRISNQRTLGLSEEEILENVERFAVQLAAREQQAENELVEKRRTSVEDEVYKSYGVLRYARKLSLKESMIYLSRIRMGVANGIISFKKPVNIYGLMVNCQPASLAVYSGMELDAKDTDMVRAEYVRRNLPELR